MTTPEKNLPAAPGGGALVASLASEGGVMTVAQLKANRQLMKDAMSELMEKGVHYGIIKGTEKPTLFKPGAELLFVLFRVEGEPIVEDLSDEDCIRYRVKMRGIHIPTGQTVGWGVGECSTDEEKYKWRACYNTREWEATPEDRQRVKYGYNRTERQEFETKQVRTNPADAANTILKMAEKRAKVDCALSFTAASDVFSQDLDDLAQWLREKETGVAEDELPEHTKAGTRAPQRKSAPSSNAPAANAQAGKVNEAQLSVLVSQMDHAGVAEKVILEKFGLDKLDDLPFAKLNEAIQYCRNVNAGPQS